MISPHYLLDTATCLLIARHHPSAVRQRFARHASRELAISVITLGELLARAETSPSRERALAGIHHLAQLLPVCPLPETAAAHYGQIAARFQARGEAMATNDIWVAAHALAAGWILVSPDAGRFAQVPGLQFENWMDSND